MHLSIIPLFSLTVTSTFFFFFNDTAPTEIYTLSLHDALPISPTISPTRSSVSRSKIVNRAGTAGNAGVVSVARSEEHTSELQSHVNLVCRLLLEKKKNTTNVEAERDG